jgi:hypothetical protein
VEDLHCGGAVPVRASSRSLAIFAYV